MSATSRRRPAPRPASARQDRDRRQATMQIICVPHSAPRADDPWSPTAATEKTASPMMRFAVANGGSKPPDRHPLRPARCQLHVSRRRRNHHRLLGL